MQIEALIEAPKLIVTAISAANHDHLPPYRLGNPSAIKQERVLRPPEAAAYIGLSDTLAKREGE
jgi:hypothetical protein